MIQQVHQVQLAPSFRRADPANAADSLAVASAPPVGLARPTNGFSPRWLRLLPFAAGSDDGTFVLQVVGWTRVGTLWVPTILYQATCTLSTFVGVSGGTVTNSERFADTIATTANKGGAGVDCVVLSPADNTPAHVLVDAKGTELVEVRASASGNALYAWL